MTTCPVTCASIKEAVEDLHDDNMIMEVVIDGLVVYVAIAGIAEDMLGVPTRIARKDRQELCESW